MRPALLKKLAYTSTIAYPVMSRARVACAAGASSVTHVLTNEAISKPWSVRPAFRAPAWRRSTEAGTASGGIQLRTTPSAISPASSSISGPSAPSTTRTGRAGGGAVILKFFTR